MTEKKTGRLCGKIVLLSAAAQGIGAAAAELMALEGATVIATDIQGDKVKALAKRIGGVGIEMDATDENQWQEIARRIEGEFGHLNVLVNNVGWAVQKPFWEYSLPEFRKHFQLNTESTFLGSKTCAPLLERGAVIRGKTSSIVNIASVAAVLAYPAQLAYNAAKAAVVSMSRSMAVDFAKNEKKIRSNAILPGVIETEILRTWFEAARSLGLFGDGTREEAWQAMVDSSPMKVLGQPQDIADAILYFASDQSAYANGTEIRLDGAWTA